ncbi:FMN-binding protein [Candidatus Formimonas warabiya]|uniref:FMN-binding domain-containing protein n=1 Tax=Formimonas warabiya TaxID=1761012 RepID=A0A3G1L335_FORW1|nr:FMN-binding protein [Candidatus Formimonas warabiya]ATW28875.1 hypothetical protein DCMF_24425 [Candidatus Formimonas warabiya]
MKLFGKIILSIGIIFVLAAAGGMLFLTRGLESGRNLVIGEVHPSLLNDGTYQGEYQGGRWSNQINVTIKEHKITQIDLVKDVKFPQPAVADELFNKVMEKQNTNVDAVTGSTVTCKAYLKSIENALKK